MGTIKESCLERLILFGEGPVRWAASELAASFALVGRSTSAYSNLRT
jgi:hypothetical protein